MTPVGVSMDIEGISKIAQSCYSSNPVIVLGSGASAPHGVPGMGALQDYLLTNISVDQHEEDSWIKVRADLERGFHLEKALIDKALPPTLTNKIVSATWRCINDADKSVCFKVIKGSCDFPLSKLLSALFRSSHGTINIVTTNYDRIAEYACDAAGLVHAVGFLPGYIRTREGSEPLLYYRGAKSMRIVRIWKVHGSLDWFERRDSTKLSAPLFELPDNSLTPLIVTPGLNKFERTYDEPFRSAIQGADKALENAQGYLCVGFGFRDTHIEPKMLERCKQISVPVTVMGLALTDEAKEFLRNRAGARYLGIEKGKVGSRVYVPDHPDGIDLPDVDIWSLDGFIKMVS